MNLQPLIHRTFCALGLALVATFALAQEEEEVLNIYTWSDYIAEDTLRKLDKSLLPSLRYMDRGVQTQLARMDSGNETMANWLWGFTTVGINADTVRAALGSTPMLGNAHKFINFVMRPEVHAALTNKVFYANPNTESKKFINPEVASNPTVFLSPTELGRMTPPDALNYDLRRLRTRTHTSFKTGL